MNRIGRLRTPEYIVIPEYFIDRFEYGILNSYYRRIENLKHIKMELPHIVDDLMLSDAIDPETWAASFLGFENKNPNYFLNLSSEMTPDEISILTNDICADLEGRPQHIFDDCLYEDVKSFLDSKNMSYVDINIQDIYIGFNQTGNDLYKNLPIKQVW